MNATRKGKKTIMEDQLETWLKEIRRRVDKGESDVYFVAGNEACDLDSMASSLVVAYFSSQEVPGSVFIPIFRCKADKYDANHWYRKLFTELKLPPWESFFFEDSSIVINGLSAANVKGLIMVDHNHVDSFNEQYWRNEKVYGIIDHHETRTDPMLMSTMPLAVSSKSFLFQLYRNESVGSCLSIVLDEIVARKPASLANLGIPLLSLSLVTLVEDTHNFEPSLCHIRWSEIDVRVFDILQSHVSKDALVEQYRSEKQAWIKQVYEKDWDSVLLLDHKTFRFQNGVMHWSSLNSSIQRHLLHKPLQSLIQSIEDVFEDWFVISGIYSEDDDVMRREFMLLSKHKGEAFWDDVIPSPHKWIYRRSPVGSLTLWECVVSVV
eukprot:Gregarina_sp_Poly_1__4837@NODE_2578_length_1956_cov_37_106406_g1636_i0_p1_GENE_NODE_2578_length_1956_cov_37_106406_g1636_i0NODE_2578_length_1956_cov_37_106406_g1636_i0_p1_ORF_typecomplete_len379_score39_87DHH/PF01368_20/1_2e10DHH/PF01368_20/3_5e03TFIIA_gamma_N/PF02268_16/0_056TFIIA_gamma_N/PF02268_16/1_7e03DHHA2/PF02833_14/3_8e02DHHA2/PF02833_14/0_55DUF4473/PF14747_6/3_6e02DUF4473/PF14747_6/3_3_NODE_2578_length_1956_cov_37_106406_g1636_i02281364